MNQDQLISESNSPLRQPTFYILLSLAPGDRHGYSILRDVEDLSGGEVKLSTGTLYEAIARLLDRGWIERVVDNPGDARADTPGKPRKTYRLTILGRRVLMDEVSRMQILVGRARAMLDQAKA